MGAETLVLDQSYQPLMRVSWQRAVTLLFQSKIEVVEEYEDHEIKSVTFSIKMPSVVRFINAIRRKKKVVKFSRSNIYDRDKGRCQYCAKKVPLSDYTYDHVIPRAQGGKTVWENIVVSCVLCNQKKGGRTPQQSGMKLCTKPIRPKRLNSHLRVSLSWRDDMPQTWRAFLDSAYYWNGELDA